MSKNLELVREQFTYRELLTIFEPKITIDE